jgi:hypothetical protein
MIDVDITREQRTKAYAFLNRRRLLKLICMVGLGPCLLISACDHPGLDPSPKHKNTGNNKMESTLATSDTRQHIPPLDVMQPQEIKTATFALG